MQGEAAETRTTEGAANLRATMRKGSEAMIEIKRTTMRGAVCLATAAALTLSIAPVAFAAVEVGNKGDFGTDKKASTTVQMEVNVDKIAASVPLTLKVAAKTNGGAMDLPATGLYKIENKAPLAIHVSNVKAELGSGLNAGWAIKAGPIAADTESTSANKNEFAFTVNGLDLSTAMGANGIATTGSSWNVDAGSNAAPKDLSLPLTASTSRLNTDKSVTGTFMTVTYTIAPGSQS